MKSKRPLRRIQTEIYIEADSWQDLRALMDKASYEISNAEKADENSRCVWGNNFSGGNISIEVDHSMTGPQNEIQEWIGGANQKEKLAGRGHANDK